MSKSSSVDGGASAPPKPRRTPEKREQHAAYMRDYYKRTATTRREYQKQKAAEHRRALSKLKSERGCRDCGESDPRVLQFHHRDPDAKSFTIGQKCGRLGLASLVAETEKCDVLCANCHIKEHNEIED